VARLGFMTLVHLQPNVCREIGFLFTTQTKNDVIQGAGQLGKITSPRAKLPGFGCHSNKK